MRSSTLAALAATLTPALAAYQGFNYGATFTNGAAKAQSDFEAEFKAAQALPGTNGAFTSARLYTMIQHGTTNTPISALAAAVSTKTSLLLGLWASAGDAVFNNEIAALKAAISSQGAALAPLIAGISVGSEDMYRISPTGLLNKENPGVGPQVIADYIKRTKEALAGTPWASVPVGHVDTWTAWVNGSNSAAIDACDWLGVDAYPYFQNTMANGIENGQALFNDAYSVTVGASKGKPVWITEAGWPVSGKDSGAAVASPQNAESFYKSTGCSYFGKTNTWWYTLLDAAPDTPNPSFGVISSLGGQPAFDLSCAAASKPSSAGNNAQAQTSAASSSAVAPAPSSSAPQREVSGSGSSSAAAASLPTTAVTATDLPPTVVPVPVLPSSSASRPAGLPVGTGVGGNGTAPVGTGGVNTPVPSPSPTGPAQAAAAAFGVPAMGAAVVAGLVAIAL